MQVFLHLLDGTTSLIDIQPDSTLEAILTAANSPNCRAVFEGAHLASLDSLRANANIYLTADLDGGKKKKKKKVYTTKKKNKHIHKRVKLGIYNLYSIDGTFYPTQAKAQCPNNAKPVPPADPAPSWPNTGTATTADSATPPSRWTQKQSRRTRKS
jgi:small subunit ribosomal protein S27Ae